MAKKTKEQYVIVRSTNAGCFAGILVSQDGESVLVNDCRRLWYWKGAASLSQLAMEGTKTPSDCKFPCETQRHAIMQVIEIIPCTVEAEKSIRAVPVWEA